MILNIGELVAYVEQLKASNLRRWERQHKIIQDLVAIKKELEEQADGDAQVIAVLEEKLKSEQEKVSSCVKCFKELEDAWSKRDEKITHWFKAMNFSTDHAQALLRYLLETR